MLAPLAAFRCVVLTFVGVLALGTAAAAQDARFFRIGTGGIGGTYYPIGGIIASAISSPPGSRACDKGGSCGVTGLVAIAQTSDGSIANVKAIADGAIDSGFVQSDVAHWAYTGTGIFRKQKPRKTIRAIANLYPESVHIVVRDKVRAKTPTDLKGLRIGLDKLASGTRADARLIFQSYGLEVQRDLRPYRYGSQSAALRLIKGQLDAFVAVGGYPLSAVELAFEKSSVRLLPLTGKPIDKLLSKYAFFSRDEIPADTYGNETPVPTVSVNALWLVPEDADEELIYQITKALWNENARELLDAGHLKGRQITLETALQGISIPLHRGARRFYREQDLVE